jgi:hypothetical protein
MTKTIMKSVNLSNRLFRGILPQVLIVIGCKKLHLGDKTESKFYKYGKSAGNMALELFG